MSREAKETMPHVDEGVLHTYLDGELTGAEREQVLAHLGECATCRHRLDEERALAARAGELLARAAPPVREPPVFAPLKRSRAPSWRVPAAWAATVTIAFGMGWYAQGERLAHDLARGTAQSEVRSPVAVLESPPAGVAKVKRPAAPDRSIERSGAPLRRAENAAPREDADRRFAAGAAAPQMAPIAPTAVALRDEAGAWPSLDPDSARVLLGRAPAVLPGRAVRRLAHSPTEDGLVLIEQEWKPGIVLRLYERRAVSAELDAPQPSSQRARAAPSALARRGENLARYVNSLRVEIAGPLAADSLAQLLELVE